MTLPAIDERGPAALPARLSPATAVDLKGLTAVEADRRRVAQGGNALPDVGAHPLARAIEKFWSPVPWMLEGAIALELAPTADCVALVCSGEVEAALLDEFMATGAGEVVAIEPPAPITARSAA